MDTKKREVIVENDLIMPLGITIDYFEQKIYWTDRRRGIYYRIETVDLNGENRRIVETGTHQIPYGIAVNTTHIFWADSNNNAVWSKSKNNPEQPSKKLMQFNEKPIGLVVNNFGILNPSDCHQNIIKHLSQNKERKSLHETKPEECQNNGIKTQNGCECPKGFVGARCEISIYSFYCLNGSFHMDGTPKCKCFAGYTGVRCERELCDGFCLNNGYCEKSEGGVKCNCPNGYYGTRCEKDGNYEELCKLLCETAPSDVVNSLGNLCR